MPLLPPSNVLAAADTGTYYPVSPTRIMDTRNGTGVRKGTVGPNSVVTLTVVGRGGVPATASTVVLNVTVTGATASSVLSVYPAGVTRPRSSSLNFAAGWTGANSVTVKLGTNGQVNFHNQAGYVNVIADVYGYYSAGSTAMGGQYHPLAEPFRLFDTRKMGDRIPKGYVVYGAADWGEYNSKIRAYAVNVTVTQPVGTGFLTAWNGDGYVPNVSTLNYRVGMTVPNFAIVPTRPCVDCDSTAATWPSISVYTDNDAHIIVDVVGVYDDGTIPDGLRFAPIVPTRITDTRIGQGWPAKLGANTTATIKAPVASVDDWALALNVTAVRPTVNTVVTVWPAGIGVERPGVSNLNPRAGTIVPNAVQTMVGPNKEFNLHNLYGSCDFVVDVVGTFYQYPTVAELGLARTPLNWLTMSSEMDSPSAVEAAVAKHK